MSCFEQSVCERVVSLLGFSNSRRRHWNTALDLSVCVSVRVSASLSLPGDQLLSNLITHRGDATTREREKLCFPILSEKSQKSSKWPSLGLVCLWDSHSEHSERKTPGRKAVLSKQYPRCLLLSPVFLTTSLWVGTVVPVLEMSLCLLEVRWLTRDHTVSGKAGIRIPVCWFKKPLLFTKTVHCFSK